MKQFITGFIDLFYPPIRRFMPLHTFRYAACGGGNTVLGLLVYFIGYHFLFNRTVVDLGFYAFKPHMAALFVS
ncbi:MAG TPA: GtrA family protein, partial [Ferruginibacter sp.]|nr:GtrA family protein [Ferruginibacter sp.]